MSPFKPTVGMDVRLKWVHRDRDRHGNVRVYFWRRGSHRSKKVRIHEAPGSDAFLARDRELVALSAVHALAPEVKERPGALKARTLGWLVERYKRDSADYRALDAIGRRNRASVLDHILAEPLKPGADKTFLDYPIDMLRPKAIRVLRDRKAHARLPGSANNRVRALRGLFKWATRTRTGRS